ncbi:MAG: CNNM domain-containing protein [Kiritimatiellia bacterium]
MVTFLLIVATVVALASSAFCAGAETAFMSVSRGRITHLARAGSVAATRVQAALREMNVTLTTLLIGNNLSNVAFSSAAAALGTRLFAHSPAGHAGWTVASAFTVLYLSEFLPKLFCSTRPLTRSLALAAPFRVFTLVLSPLTRLAMAITGLFIPKGETKERVTSKDLLRILQDRKDGVRLTDFESALISRILVMRRKGEFMTVEGILRALDEE